MDQKEKTDIRSLNLKELTVFMEQLGEKAFRAKQIYQWLHGKQAASFEEMTNIPKALIEKLKENSHLVSIKQEAVQTSKIDGTRKYLFLLDDGNVIESVFMRYKHGNSVCISSQVGCRMGCRFCASTLDGLVRGSAATIRADAEEKITRSLIIVLNVPGRDACSERSADNALALAFSSLDGFSVASICFSINDTGLIIYLLGSAAGIFARRYPSAIHSQSIFTCGQNPNRPVCRDFGLILL